MKKIMFNDRYGLTAAVLQGRKTMTRRICKEYATHQPILARDVESFRFYPDENIVEFLMKDGTTKVSVPPYKNNEFVAVAQAYKDTGLFDIYRGPEDTKGWNNKMFVRADLMTHFGQITDINIERLQDISDEDCLKEGIIIKTVGDFGTYAGYGYGERRASSLDETFSTPRKAFASLIDRISGKGTWQSNPIVVAYSFRLIK